MKSALGDAIQSQALYDAVLDVEIAAAVSFWSIHLPPQQVAVPSAFLFSADVHMYCTLFTLAASVQNASMVALALDVPAVVIVPVTPVVNGNDVFHVVIAPSVVIFEPLRAPNRCFPQVKPG